MVGEMGDGGVAEGGRRDGRWRGGVSDGRQRVVGEMGGGGVG